MLEESGEVNQETAGTHGYERDEREAKQGAEARIYNGVFLGRPAVIKQR